MTPCTNTSQDLLSSLFPAASPVALFQPPTLLRNSGPSPSPAPAVKFITLLFADAAMHSLELHCTYLPPVSCGPQDGPLQTRNTMSTLSLLTLPCSKIKKHSSCPWTYSPIRGLHFAEHRRRLERAENEGFQVFICQFLPCCKHEALHAAK